MAVPLNSCFVVDTAANCILTPSLTNQPPAEVCARLTFYVDYETNRVCIISLDTLNLK